MRSSAASIDRSLPQAERFAALMRRLHGIGLTHRHPESGIALTMSLDYSLTSVEMPSTLVTDLDFTQASEILSAVASTLYKAVSRTNLALAKEFTAALGAPDA